MCTCGITEHCVKYSSTRQLEIIIKDFWQLNTIFSAYLAWTCNKVTLGMLIYSTVPHKGWGNPFKILGSQNINSYDIYKKQTSLKQLFDFRNDEITFVNLQYQESPVSIIVWPSWPVRWVTETKHLTTFLDEKKTLFIQYFWSAGWCPTNGDKSKMNI